MASTDKAAPDPEKTVPPPEAKLAPEPEKAVPPPEAPAPEPERAAPPPPESKATPTLAAPPPDYLVVADVVLRVLLFAAALTAVVVMVSANQTEIFQLPNPPFLQVPLKAKFRHSPAFVYFVAALSVAGLYSIITTAISLLVLLKPRFSTKLLPHFVIFDVLILGIVAAATGAAAAVAYIGLKGNSHVGWTKVCNAYDKFCRYIAASISVSLFASVVLVLLVMLSAYSLSKKIPK